MFAVEGTLAEGRYEATAPGWNEPEWPPHPARLFMALVASVEDEADRRALAWLEQREEPPLVWACDIGDTRPLREERWVVTNRVERKGGNQSWPGRTNGMRTRAGVAPREAAFAVVWAEATPPEDVAGRLDQLARRTPYLGRVSSRVSLATTADPVRRPRCMTYRPGRIGEPGVPLRVPYPGYLDLLREAYETGRRAHDLGLCLPYRVDHDGPPPTARGASPFEDMIVFGFQAPMVPIGGDRFLWVGAMLRRAVLDRIASDIPAVVSGHGADGTTHTAFLALPDVGHRHADGHLLGVAVALPGLDDASRCRVAAALLAGGDGGLSSLCIDRLTHVSVRYDPERTAPVGATVERWVGPLAGAREWLTATPLMLDRFPKRRDDPAALIADCAQRAGYARPEVLKWSRTPLFEGAVPAPRSGTLPAGRPRRPLLHARLRFPTAVRGPVMIGALRYLGSGLCVPIPGGGA